jgi:hypothetical protein
MSNDQRSTAATDRSTEATDDGTTPQRKQRLELSIPQLLAGGLAAASAAVVASWLGVAGTVTGAVVASIVAAVSTALYKHSLERSSQVIRETLPVLPVLPDRYRSAYVNNAASETTRIEPAKRPRPRTGSSPTAARHIRWGAVAVSAVLTLVVGFGMLTAVEGVLGKPVEGGGGRTTVGRIFSHGGSHHHGNSSPSTPPPSTSTGETSSVPSTTAPDTTAPTTEPPATTTPETTAPTTPTAPPSVTQPPPAAPSS